MWDKVNYVWVSDVEMLWSQFRIAYGRFMKSSEQWEVTVLFWCWGQTNKLLLQSTDTQKP